MFETLREGFERVIVRVRGAPLITQNMVEETTNAVRKTLLDADVNYEIVEKVVNEVVEEVVGKKAFTSAGDLFVYTLFQKIKDVLGKAEPLNLTGKPAVIMLSGLHGSGKTTTAAKIAKLMLSKGRSVFLIPCDLKRPAAVEQLTILGERAGADVFDISGFKNSIAVATKGVKFAKKKSYDVVIIDTAGRLHIDKELVKELNKIYREVKPAEHLLVLDSMMGQESVRVAREFKRAVPITGFVLTKVDTDSRGGAALSVRYSTGRPIKLIGVGEKIDDIEIFDPDRIARRILSMGELDTLVEKVTEVVNEEKQKDVAQKVAKGRIDMNDLLEHIRVVRRVGGFRKMIDMLPAGGKIFKGSMLNFAEDELKKMEAIILSMTKEERSNPDIINGSRRMRIARGSGTTVADVNRLLKSYKELKKVLKKFKKDLPL